MHRALRFGRARGWGADGQAADGRGGAGRSIVGHPSVGRVSGRRGAVGAAAGAAGLVLVLAACGASAGSRTVATTPVNGGTATYAIQPASNVNYIFPFMGGTAGTHYTIYNVNDFQYLMYRPLYWFGQGVQPYLNESLSLAYKPVYHGQRVSITLKRNYKWSNGEPVDAKDVVFWMNMMQASQNTAQDAPTGWAWVATTPGGLPGDVTDVRATGRYTVSMTIKGAYSADWFTNNELSQITPMPLYWDRTSATHVSHCATVVSDCFAVYSYLAAQATNPQTYPSSKIWSVVDGPWRLQSYTSQGTLTLAYNSQYSGPVAPQHITKLVEVPFTSEQAEYNVLQNPTGSQAIDVGYLPTVDAPVPPGNAAVGANPSSLPNYRLNVVYPWQLSYFPYNFNNNTGQGVIFKQQYFRQAFQSLVDQEGVIEGPLHGYGKATIGPVGDYPVTNYLSRSLAQKGDQWPLSPARAESLLSSHGWSVQPGGPDTCIHPGRGNGKCGPGVPPGAQLKFKLIYASGLDWMESQVKELASNASEVGIQLTVTAEPFDTVAGTAFTPCKPGKPCTWQLADWGSWTYAPDLLPTGETLFATTALNNVGGYSDPRNDHLIQATVRARTPAELTRAMYAWQDYLAGQLPVVYQPDNPSLVETINNLHTGPQNSALTITPEDWYFLK
jgi:peptide/nickel transport system substrate-binding protein